MSQPSSCGDDDVDLCGCVYVCGCVCVLSFRLKLFIGPKMVQYSGQRDIDSLVEFVEQQTQSKEVWNLLI